MRIVAGTYRGRRLTSPPGDDTRPTTDKVREAVFNALGSLDVVRDAQVIDLFAGTGALGLEALSRGARHATFVERGRPALRALRANIDALEVADRTTVVDADALTVLPRLRLGHHSGSASSRSDDQDEGGDGGWVVFADPPYGFDRWGALFDRLAAWPEAPLVVAEAGAEIDPPPPWKAFRTKRYGRTWVAFCAIGAQ